MRRSEAVVAFVLAATLAGCEPSAPPYPAPRRLASPAPPPEDFARVRFPRGECSTDCIRVEIRESGMNLPWVAHPRHCIVRPDHVYPIEARYLANQIRVRCEACRPEPRCDEQHDVRGAPAGPAPSSWVVGAVLGEARGSGDAATQAAP